MLVSRHPVAKCRSFFMFFHAVNMDQPVYFSLWNMSYCSNNSDIVVTRIGPTNETSLICHTDSTTCCRGIHNPDSYNSFGEWLFPNGTMITRNGVTGDGFYWIRYFKVVRLYRQGDIQAPLGRYCCRIPDSGGEMRTFCANLVGKSL